MIKNTMITVLFTGTLVVGISAVPEAEAKDVSQKSGAPSPRLSGDRPWCSTPSATQPDKSGLARCAWDSYEDCQKGKATSEKFCFPQSEISK